MTSALSRIMLLALFAMTLPAFEAGRPPPNWKADGSFSALFVADAEAMANWYVNTLGFRIVMLDRERKSPDIARAALLERDGAIVELLQQRIPQGIIYPDRPRDPQALGIIKTGFVVEDIRGFERTLIERGVSFNHRSVKSSREGLMTFAIRDPEGNTIQFFGK